MTDRLQILKTFKTTLISFVDELIGQYPNDSELILIRIFLKDQIPIQDIMNEFIIKLDKYKPLIEAKDDAIFKNDDFLNFGGQTGLNNLKKEWNANNIDEEDKNIIWEWIKSFIFLCEKYQKLD